MEENTNTLESLIAKVEEFGKTNIELYKLKLIDKASASVSSIVLIITILIFVLIFLLFVNVALAYWVGSMLGKVYLGFLIVAGFYLLLALLFGFVFNKAFKKSIGNIIIRKLT